MYIPKFVAIIFPLGQSFAKIKIGVGLVLSIVGSFSSVALDLLLLFCSNRGSDARLATGRHNLGSGCFRSQYRIISSTIVPICSSVFEIIPCSGVIYLILFDSEPPSDIP